MWSRCDVFCEQPAEDPSCQPIEWPTRCGKAVREDTHKLRLKVAPAALNKSAPFANGSTVHNSGNHLVPENSSHIGIVLLLGSPGLALVILFFGAWFLYDGYVAYPRQHEQALAAQQSEQTPPPDAAQPLDPEPRPRLHSEKSIMTQRGIGFGCSALGLLCLAGVPVGYWLTRRDKRNRDTTTPPPPPMSPA